MAGIAAPASLPHLSLLYTSSPVGSSGAPASLPHLALVTFAAGSINSARNPAPLPSLSSLLGGTHAYNLPIVTGSYTITGGNVEADYQASMAASSYAVTGVSVGLRRGATLSMVSGSYGVNGQTVQLRRGTVMPLAAGTYTLTGVDAQLVKSTAKTMFLASGTYQIAGSDLNVGRHYVMTCAPGSYQLNGQDLLFQYTEVQHYFVPYLIGAMEDSARTMVEQIHGTVLVTGSGGTVVSQSPEFMSVVLKGQVVSITMGGPINYSRRKRQLGLPPYTRGSGE